MYPDVRIKPLATKVKLITGGAVPFPVTRYSTLLRVDAEISRWKRKIYVQARSSGKSTRLREYFLPRMEALLILKQLEEQQRLAQLSPLTKGE